MLLLIRPASRCIDNLETNIESQQFTDCVNLARLTEEQLSCFFPVFIACSFCFEEVRACVCVFSRYTDTKISFNVTLSSVIAML